MHFSEFCIIVGEYAKKYLIVFGECATKITAILEWLHLYETNCMDMPKVF
jgi:hypothetical protein